MALRIPWDQQETALLIDACVRVKNKELPRKEAIKEVSELLRRRALRSGMQIDDVFRNENGISFQMGNLEALMDGRSYDTRHHSKMFEDLLAMYRTDRSGFDEILAQAREACGQKMSNRELFAGWLSANVPSCRINDCFKAMDEVETIARKKKVITGSIYDVTDPSLTARIAKAVHSDWAFRITHRKQMQTIDEAASLYHRYTKENRTKQSKKTAAQISRVPCAAAAEPAVEIREPKTAQSVRETFTFNEKSDSETEYSAEKPADSHTERTHREDTEDTILVDFERDTDFSFTKPVSGSYFGETFSVSSWRQLYIKFCEILIDDYPGVFEELRDPARSAARYHIVYDLNTSKRRLTEPACIADGYYVETNRSASDLIKNLRFLLDRCRVDYENVEIRYRRRSGENRGGGNPSAESGGRYTQKSDKIHGSRTASEFRREDTQYSKSHPVQIEFEKWLEENQTPEGSIRTYSSSVKRIGDYLLKSKREDRHLFSIFGISRLEDICQKLQCEWKYDDSGRFDSLDLYALRKYISFRKNSSSNAENEEIRGRFSTVLMEYFNDGYRVNSLIDRNSFREYYRELYGAELSQDDDKLVQTIQKAGRVQNDRIFALESGAQSDLLDDIQAEIAKVFREGATCVFVSAVYERYQNELAEQLRIYSEDVLRQQLLDTCYGAYQLKRNYFSVRGREANVNADVAKIMRQSQLPLNYRQIHEILWYIPLDRITQSLRVSSDIVSVAKKTYFYAWNLPINEEETEQIAEILHEQLLQKSFITDTELRSLIEKRCPSAAVNTEDFTAAGLRKVLSVLLRDQFSFHGPIICERGQEFNLGLAFESFCESREKMTLEELKGFAGEINSPRIYWEAVYHKMLRVSRTEFVRKSDVEFPVEEIDAALDQLLEGDYIPIQKFSLFLHFPPISVRWNEFVLEGYVAQYSRKFVLLHARYTEAGCFGAIVRRTSAIKDFRSLIVDVLAHADGWKSGDDALELLVKNGYLQRRRKKDDIEAVIAEARLRKGILDSNEQQGR